MDPMAEIVTVAQVDRLFLGLAVALPLLGAAAGGAVGARTGAAGRGALRGLLIGLLGPANLALWWLYNAITDWLGLDSVANLLLNLALFVVLGAAAGLWLGRAARRRAARETDSTVP